LLLPNTALLSDQQCRQLRAYVDAGGSLLATFETSMYNELNERRSDFGLAGVFGIRKAGDLVGTVGNAYLARIEKQHEILNGFSGTNWIPGAANRIPIAPVDDPILTVVPGFVAYPPELSYPLQERTSEPAIVVRQNGKSRLVYFPGDIERTMWRSGHTDLARLLQNAIRWVAGATQPIHQRGSIAMGMPIFDNLEFLLTDRRVHSGETASVEAKLKGYIESGKLVLEALTYIRGRSIPHQFMVVDEAQNLTPHEIKTIASRVGEGTKLVLTGDAEQIDTPYLDANSNGLSFTIEKLKAFDLVGHVTLSRPERSGLASLVVKEL